MKTHTGLHIRHIREAKEIDREHLAHRVHLDPKFIGKIENQEVEPSASDLLKIANALGTDITALITGKEFHEKQTIVTRPGDRIGVDRIQGFNYESLAPYYSDRHIEPFIVEVFAQDPEHLEYSQHVGEEFHYVLEGSLKIIIDKTEHLLNPGDSIYFDSALPHALYAVTDSTKLVSAIYNSESVLQLTKSRHIRDLIQTAKHLGGKDIAVVCPDNSVMEVINRGIEEGVIATAYLVGDSTIISDKFLRFPEHYKFVNIDSSQDTFYQNAATKGVAIIRNGQAQMLMKGKINTALFVKAVLHKETGITTGRRLSLVSLFGLPKIDRLIFLTDPGINPELVIGDDLQSSIDIINNAIDVAKSLGVVRPKVALLEANEMPSEKIPMSLYEKQLSEMEWEDADVYGPLSYDLALYEESVKQKGFGESPVAGKADILVVPYISGGNFLYKAWAMTMNIDAANIVLGARAPLIITSRGDTSMTKLLTICACCVCSEYLLSK
jgi:phosphate butyryltransferase